jgi:hypothetical protein
LDHSIPARNSPRPHSPQAAARPRAGRGTTRNRGTMAGTGARQNRRSESISAANTQLWITPLLAFGTLRPGVQIPPPRLGKSAR